MSFINAMIGGVFGGIGVGLATCNPGIGFCSTMCIFATLMAISERG